MDEPVTSDIPGKKDEPLTEVYQDVFGVDDPVPETGKYRCIFCGQIKDFAEGETFSECDANHGIDQPNWKNID